MKRPLHTVARMMPRVIMIIALGVATAVLITWGIALWPQKMFTFVSGLDYNSALPGKPSYIDGVGVGNSRSSQGFVRRITLQTRNTPIDNRRLGLLAPAFAVTPRPTLPPGYPSLPERLAAWPGWLRQTVPSTSDGKKLETLAVGFPWPCVRSFAWSTPTGRATAASLRLLPKSSYRFGQPYDEDIGCVPLIPYWPGLLANTALYASVWGMLIFGVSWVASRRRRGRSLCPHCGYDTQGLPPASVCPECGRRISS